MPRRRAGEDPCGLTDHRNQAHGAGDQPPAQLWGDVALEVPIQPSPVGLAFCFGQIGGVAQA